MAPRDDRGAAGRGRGVRGAPRGRRLVVVVNKPAGLVVHPARGHEGGTLVNGLLARGLFAATAEEDEQHERPGIVHRLDKGTSGVMVVARTPAAREELKAQFQAHTIERAYARHRRRRGARRRRTTRSTAATRATGCASRRACGRGKRAVTHVRVARAPRGARPTSSARWRRAARTRSACTSPRAARRCSATRSTAGPRGTRACAPSPSASGTRRCTRASSASCTPTTGAPCGSRSSRRPTSWRRCGRC